MKNNSRANGATQKINTPLTPAESGLSFTVATFTMLITSLIFTACVSIIAMTSGLELDEFNKRIENNLLYTVLSYALSGVALGLSVLIICRMKGRRPFADIPLKKAKPRFWAIAVLMSVGLIFGFTEINGLFISFLQSLGYTKPDMTLPNDKWYELAIWIIVVAAMPAFFEESIFRGYLLEGMKQLGTVFALIVGGLLFSVFHQNPQQTPYQFICGVAITLLAIKGGSMLPCVLVHFLNNAVILVTDYLNVTFSPTASICLTVTGVACFIGAIVWLILSKKQKTEPVEIENPLNHTKSRFLLFAVPGLAACVLMWIADLITYFGG